MSLSLGSQFSILGQLQRGHLDFARPWRCQCLCGRWEHRSDCLLTRSGSFRDQKLSLYTLLLVMAGGYSQERFSLAVILCRSHFSFPGVFFFHSLYPALVVDFFSVFSFHAQHTAVSS